MPAGNRHYDRLADTWWDEGGVLNLLETAVNPARLDYFRGVLARQPRPGAGEGRGLDVGSGGGSLTEGFARLGFRMTGVDPSRPSVRAARDHAAFGGLGITYGAAAGEALPFGEASFDFVCCCDVLEHVADPSRLIAEAARVLRPGGVFFYDTLNRTLRSNLVAVRFAQDWHWSRFLPADVHRWSQFIRPRELHAVMSRHGLRNLETLGMGPGVHPLRVVLLVRRLKRGKITYGEFGRAIRYRVTRDTSVSYLGWAIRRPGL